MKESCMPDMSWRSITPRQEEEAAIEIIDHVSNELDSTSTYSKDAREHINRALLELRAAQRAMKEQAQSM